MAGEAITGPVPDGWKTTTLGEVVKQGGGHIQTGPFGSQLHASDYVPVGVPSIMPVNIGDNRIIEQGIARITEIDAERLSRHRVQAGDIIYSRRGDVERRALIRPKQEGWLCGTGCLKVRIGNGGVDSRFVSYYLGHPDVRAWILQHAVGATMPNLNTSIMKAIPLLVPPLEEQQAIACILSILDDKIELNRRMNQTLEGIARAIFKSWFVDFDPVQAKAAGQQPPGLAPHIADLFPDAFEASELGEIPKGWNVGTLGMIANEMRDTVQPAEIEPGTPYIALQHMPRRCIALNSWDTADDIASTKLRFKAGDILFGKLRPYFHKVGPAPLDGVCSTDIVVCRPQDDLWYDFALAHMSSDAFVAYTDSGSTGTKMPRTNWRYMSAFKIALPPSRVAARFSEIVRPMINRIRHSIFEQQSLAELHNTLLPRLISGELRVPDAERIVGRCL
jgi:type I restriction enzyme S subunit